MSRTSEKETGRKSIGTRLLAVFMSVVLVVGLAPTLSFANEGTNDSDEAAVQQVDEAAQQADDSALATASEENVEAAADEALDVDVVTRAEELGVTSDVVALADELNVDPELLEQAMKAINEGDSTYVVMDDGTAFATAPDGTLLVGDEAQAAIDEAQAEAVADEPTAAELTVQAQDVARALAAIDDIPGSGTETDPYLISTADELYTVTTLINSNSSYAGACMTLQSDIDLSMVSGLSTWTPIGTESLKYGGTFDGGGHVISGMKVVSTSPWYQGLFGFINGATIENFTLEGSVTGTTYLGGVVGDAWASTFRNITNEATVTSTNSSSAPTLGGIAGYARYSTFENCLNTADITADYMSTTTGSMAGYHAVGGIVGTAYLSDSATTEKLFFITRCANTGNIVTSLSKQGGLVGESYNQYGLTITDCYNRGYVGVTDDVTASTSQSYYIGGIIGYSNYSGSSYLEQLGMTNCYNVGTLMSNASYTSDTIYIGGLVSHVSGSRPTESYLPLVSNNYCLDTTATYMFGASSSSYAAGEIEGKAEFAKEDTMKSEDFASTLGSNWQADTGSSKINDGWPYLRWQNSDATYEININVTLENENNNDDANAIMLTLTGAGGVQTPTAGADNSAVAATWSLTGLSDGTSYDYTVEKKGYVTQTGTATINKTSVDLDIVLEPVAYSQTIIASPADADVTLTKNGSTNVEPTSSTIDEATNTCTYVFGGLYNSDTLSYKVSRFGYTAQSGSLPQLNFGDARLPVTLTEETTYTAEFVVSVPSDYEGSAPSLQITYKGSGDYQDKVIYDSADDSSITFGNDQYTYTATRLIDGAYSYTLYASGYPSVTDTFTISGADTQITAAIGASNEPWDGSSVDISWYLADPNADEFYIGSAAQLAGLSALCGYTATDDSGALVTAPTFSGKTIYLTNDIDLDSHPWTPIGYYSQAGSGATQFAGVFDGNGHTIANLYVGSGSGSLMNSRGNFGHGLFSYIKGTSSARAGAMNIVFDSVYIDGTSVGVTGSAAGAVTGYAAYADVTNITVTGGTIRHEYYVGGIVGTMDASSAVVISDCTNSADVIVTKYTGGGICGNLGSGSTIQRCVNRGSVSSSNTTSSYVTTLGYGLGGIAGVVNYQSYGVSESCNYGEVSGCMTNVGGIIGCMGSSSSYNSVNFMASNCYNRGNVTNTASSYGYTNSNGATAGGIVGLLASVTTSSSNVIENCYSTGELSFADTTDVNTGSSPNYYAGQIVGQIYHASEANTTFITNSYYPGNQNTDYKAIGRIKTSSVNNIDLSNYNVTYKDESEMKSEEFVEVLGDAYVFDDGGDNAGYPLLGWQVTDTIWRVGVAISLDVTDNDDFVIANEDGTYKVTKEGEMPILTVFDENGTSVAARDDLAIVVDPDTGAYDFEASFRLPSGNYTYEVSKKGYGDANGDDTLTGSFTVSTSALDLSLQLVAFKYLLTLNVLEKDAAGNEASLDGATVVLARGGADGETIEPVSVSGGTYVYEVYNGSYWASATKYGYESASTPDDSLIKVDNADVSYDLVLNQVATYTLTIIATPRTGAFQDRQATLLLSSDEKTWDAQVGDADEYGSVTFVNEVAAGVYTYEVYAGGFVKQTDSIDVTQGDQTIEIFLENAEEWDGETVDTSFYDPTATTFEITSAGELAGLAAIVNGTVTDEGGIAIQDSFDGKTVNLRANINLNENDWTPIGTYSGPYSMSPFSGTFNGNGHVISGMYCDLTKDGTYAIGALFGSTSGATITGVEVRGTFAGSPSTSFVEAAGLVAVASGTLTISECGSEITVRELDMSALTSSSTAHIGGLIGWSMATTTITSCYSHGTIAVTAMSSVFVGGQVGFISSVLTMDACYNSCDITVTVPESANNANVGGLVGSINNTSPSISNSYNSGIVSATQRDAAQTAISTQGALIGNAANVGSAAKIVNSYWLDTSCTQAVGSSFAGSNMSLSRSDEAMRAEDFVAELNQNFATGEEEFVFSELRYPPLVWESTIVNVSLNTPPDKADYFDQENFDSTGLSLKVEYTKGDDQIVTSGWTVTDGRNLKVDQTSVTINYAGYSIEIPITVTQTTHETAADITLELEGPIVGAEPTDSVIITSEPLSNGYITYDASLVRWTHAGETFTGSAFEDATYYRAEIMLSTYYKDGDAWYVFPEDVNVSVAGVDGTPSPLETLYGTRSDDGLTYTLTCTYAVTSSATENLPDMASHLYYQGDTNARAYNEPLDESVALTLAVNGQDINAWSLAELEQLALDENIGYTGTYSNYTNDALTSSTYTGVKLYQLLSEVLPATYDDSTDVILYDSDGTPTTSTLGALRQPGRSYEDADGSGVTVPWLIAYGRDGAPLMSCSSLLAEATGPLMVVSGQGSATSSATVTNVARIELVNAEPAKTQKVTFTATCDGVTLSDLNITVTDAFGNVWAPRGGVYYLNEDETYTYTVGCAGYTTATGTVDVEQSSITVNVDLLAVYNGTPSEPEMVDGYYEIYTAEELVWWVNNASASSNVRLMDDVALNDGVTFDKDKSYCWPVDKLGKYDNAYSGIFDGNGHTIYGFYIYRENTIDLWEILGEPAMISDNIPYIGFLGYGRNATVKNLGIDGRIDVLDRPDSSMASFMNIGGIFGYGYDVTVECCTVNIGVNYTPATGSGTLDGYPYDGWPEACDLYVGGIIGNASGATITDCYTRGEAIAAGATRSSDLAGIAGRAANGTTVVNCYSTMAVSAMPYEGSSFTSYQGGIIAHVEDNTGGSTSVNSSVALNKLIDGGDDTYSVAHRVSGDIAGIDQCYGLLGLDITNAATDDKSVLNGEDITIAAALVASSYTTIGWEDVTGHTDTATSGWQFETDAYPRLWWENLFVPQTADQTSDEVEIVGIHEGDDGTGFSESNPPSKFTLNVQVGSHDTITAKVFTSTELRSMATNEKVKYSCYTYGPYGRVVTQYIPFEDLIESVGIEFDEGDALIFGGHTYSYESYFGTTRYYYPHWDSYNDSDPVEVPTAFVLRSYGSTMSGDGDTMLDYYASSADYLYAYMICFGMSSINDSSGSLFINQQTSATVSLDAEAVADKVIKDLLIDAVQRAEDDRDSTSVGDSPDEVGSGITFVPEEVMEALKEAIEAASAVLADENATNDEVLSAVEDLEAAIDAFDAAKQTGKKPVDFSALETAIEFGDAEISYVDNGTITVADSDEGLEPGTYRIPTDVYKTLVNALSQASKLVGDTYLSQAQVDEIAANLLGYDQLFEDSIVVVRETFTVTFDTRGGSGIGAEKVSDGDCATEPDPPTRDGYTFTGWYTSSECTEGTEFSFETPIESDITLYAGWLEVFTVTFNTQGGSDVPSQEVTDGDYADAPDDPTRDGYTFTGWYTDEECTQEFDFTTPITENLTLYAGWVEAVVPGPEPATPIDKSMFVVDTSSVTYTGEPIEKAIASTLVEGVDYEVTYTNNVDAGTATITITGTGDYEGTLIYEFTIERAFVRLAGDDRYGTMEEIDDTAFESANTVVLAAGSNFPDALSAAGLAGTLDAPIVLTATDALSAEAAEEITRLGASNVVIVGGENSVSAAVAQTLEAMGVTVMRVSGADRYETAVEAYYAGLGSWGTSGNGTAKTAIIAAGASFPDTLSASSYAWWATSPIFLSSSDGLDEATQTAITNGGFERIIIVGGVNSVPASVETWAYEVASTQRLSGDNRYDTSVAFATWAHTEGMSFNNAGIATGKNFPDALAGGALCGQRGSVVLLADYDGGTQAVDLLSAHKDEVSRIYFLGGVNSVTPDLTALIEARLS